MTRYTSKLHSVFNHRQRSCSTRFCRHCKLVFPTMEKRASLCTTMRKVWVSLLQVNKAFWAYAPARCSTPQNRTSGRSFRPLRRRLPPCMCQWSRGLHAHWVQATAVFPVKAISVATSPSLSASCHREIRQTDHNLKKNKRKEKEKTLRCLLSMRATCVMKCSGGPAQPTNHHHSTCAIYKLQSTNCNLQTAAIYKLQSTNYNLQATIYKLQSASYNLQATICKLQAASCKLQAASCKLQVCKLQAMQQCNLQSAVCNLQSATCSLQSAVCNQQWDVSTCACTLCIYICICTLIETYTYIYTCTYTYTYTKMAASDRDNSKERQTCDEWKRRVHNCAERCVWMFSQQAYRNTCVLNRVTLPRPWSIFSDVCGVMHNEEVLLSCLGSPMTNDFDTLLPGDTARPSPMPCWSGSHCGGGLSSHRPRDRGLQASGLSSSASSTGSLLDALTNCFFANVSSRRVTSICWTRFWWSSVHAPSSVSVLRAVSVTEVPRRPTPCVAVHGELWVLVSRVLQTRHARLGRCGSLTSGLEHRNNWRNHCDPQPLNLNLVQEYKDFFALIASVTREVGSFVSMLTGSSAAHWQLTVDERPAWDVDGSCRALSPSVVVRCMTPNGGAVSSNWLVGWVGGCRVGCLWLGGRVGCWTVGRLGVECRVVRFFRL